MSSVTTIHCFPMLTLLLSLVPSAACDPTRPGPTTPDDRGGSESDAESAAAKPIERAQVEAAQAKWCEALVEIGRVGAAGGDAKALATRVLSSAYDYDAGTVLFKPTLTSGDKTFRMTKAGALAYFVGGDPAFPDDQGFALKQWTKCRPEIAGVFADGDVAISMGNVHLESAKGDRVTVDKTFGYVRHEDGSLRIVLHHSSLPYTPPK